MDDEQISKKIVLIVASGTGGHIFPGLAVANKMVQNGVKIEWLGTPAGLENSLSIPFTIHHISMKGLRRKGVLRWFFLPFRLLVSFYQTFRILLKIKPKAVFCFGGYVSFPAGICAYVLGIPVFLQEQNSRAGLANRSLRFFAKHIFVGYPNPFGKTLRYQSYTGNPIREFLVQKSKNSIISKNIKENINILVIGGSQGAFILNQVVPNALGLLNNKNINIVHQCGKMHLTATEESYKNVNVKASVVPFINDMAQAFMNTDLVICRAGALTCTELTYWGKPSILVPLPNAADNHQFFNAKYLADFHAARILVQSELTPGNLSDLVHELLASPEILKNMGNNAKALATPSACQDIVEQTLQMI